MSDSDFLRGRGRAGFTFAVREVILIVTGVLIALSLESLWQSRSERAAEEDLLLGLRDEFVENSASLDRWLGLHERVVTTAEEFIAKVEGVPEGQRVIVPDSVIAEMARTPTYDPELTSLDAAFNSGQISLIRSVEIQRALASWTRLLTDAQEEEQRGVDLVYSRLLPHLGAATDLGPAMSWLVSDVRRVMRGLPGDGVPSTSSSVVAGGELANLLWVRYRLSSAATNELEILRTGLDEVLALLEAELH